MKLSTLVNNLDDPKIVRRLKKSLESGFNPSIEKDVVMLVELANYLVAIGNPGEALSLLEECIETNYSPELEYVWIFHGRGMLLMAYINRLLGNTSEAERLLEILDKEDIRPADRTRLEWFSEISSTHEMNYDHAMTETQKYKCQMLDAEIMGFLYFLVMLPTFRDVAPEGIDDYLSGVIKKCYSSLRTALAA